MTVVKRTEAIVLTRIARGGTAESKGALFLQKVECGKRADALNAHVLNVYEEEGVGGRGRAARTGLNAALADLESGRASVLIVSDMARLTRDPEHMLEILTRVERAGGRVVLADGTELNSAAAIFFTQTATEEEAE